MRLARLHPAILALCVVLGGLATGENALAADRYWISSSGGNWSDISNWSASQGGPGGATVPSSTDVAHFTAEGQGDCTLNANVSVLGLVVDAAYAGTITQGSAVTLTVGSTGLSLSGGVFIGGTAAIDVNGSGYIGSAFTSTSGTLSCSSGLTIDGAFAHNGGTVLLDGGSQTFSPGAAASFNNLTLDTPGNISVSGTAVVTGLFWLKRANTLNSGTVAVSGDVMATNANLSGASGTILFIGNGDQTLSANGSSGVLSSIVVDKPSGTLFVEDTIKIRGSFVEANGFVDTALARVEFIGTSLGITAPTTFFEDLVFDTPGSVAISGTVRAHSFTNTRSNCISGVLEVSGNVVSTSQSFSGVPGTLVLNGSADQTVSANGGSGKLPTLEISKSGGGVVYLQDTLKIVGGWSFLFADGVNAGTSTVEFCGGSAEIHAPSMSFANLVLSSAGNLTISGDARTTNLTIVNANALNGDAILVSGDVTTTATTMSGTSATVRLVGPGAQNVGAGGGAGKLPNFEVDKTGGVANLGDVLQVNGNWGHISGTVNPGTSTVSFVGIGTRSISGAAVFNNLMLNRSFIGETVNVESDVAVQGALNVIKGTLAIVEDNTLSVGGDFSIDPANGNLLANASTIAFNGTSAQAVDFGGRGVNNLTVSNAGGVVSFTSGVVAAEGSTATFLPGSSLKFANAQVFAFDLIDWKGAAGNPVTLRSDATGMPWFLEAAGYPSATYVDVQDSDASGGETIIATNSNDNGGNSNWAFQGAGLLSITTAATSVTNPAWVEGTSGSDAVSLQIAVDAGDPFDAVRLNPTKWFGDDASAGGASLGLLISATQATHVEVTATDALSNVNSVSQDVTWAETDLTGKYFSTDTVKIRRGDSLLLTASGAGTTLEIDGDGDGTYESSGAPGDAFPTLYATAGTFVARAKIEEQEVGSLTVVVIGVDLHGPVACELNWQRIQDTFVTPVSEIASVAFESANPFALTTSFNQNTATGVRLNLKPLKMGTPQFLARLGSGGPIFGTQEVKVFILKNLNTAIAGVAMDENGFGEGAFRFQVVPPTVIANDDPGTPETEGLFFDFLVTGGFLTVKENGQSSIRVPSTAQDENGLFEIEVLYDPSGTSVCSRIHAVQVNSPDVDAGPEHHANPCITKVCKVVWFQEEVNDETSAADKARQQGNINSFSKRFHAHPPFVPQLVDGQDHTVLWSQTRKFVFAGEEVGTNSFAALISPPKYSPVQYDVMARCEEEHCPRVPPCPQTDDNGSVNHRMLSLKPNSKAEVRAEIFYPFKENEQKVGKATPGPVAFPHGTYDLSPPNWVGFNPGPEPHIDDPKICGPVPCPHPIDTCKKPIPCRGCNEYKVSYVNHYGAYDIHIGPNGTCPTTNSPRIKDAISIVRLDAVGPKENESQSQGFVQKPDGTVFPDIIPVLSTATDVRIQVEGGEKITLSKILDADECQHEEVEGKTRKGIIDRRTNRFTFTAAIHPRKLALPAGATRVFQWTFLEGFNCGEPGEEIIAGSDRQSVSYEFGPGRHNVVLHVVDKTIGSPDVIVGKAEFHSIEVVQEECSPDCPHPGYVAARTGVEVRIIARGRPEELVNIALHVNRRNDMGDHGFARISLDGYQEDEYDNQRFVTPLGPVGNFVEGRAQFFSFSIDGQAHFPPKDGSAGIESESLGDETLTTWVIFLHGLEHNERADSLELIVFGKEIRATCNEETANVSCVCIYTPTDWEAFNSCDFTLRPHPPGDYSVDSQGLDVLSTQRDWIATKYYYTEPASTAVQNGIYVSNIAVDRFIPGVIGSGTPLQVSIDNGVVSPTARIRILATIANQKKLTLSVNGTSVDANGSAMQLGTEIDGCPELFTFNVSIFDILFPILRGSNGARPIGATNQFAFAPSQPGSAVEYTIEWIELSFDAMSPYVLIHGKGANAHYWRGFPAQLGTANKGKATACWPGVADDLEQANIPFDETISLGVDPVLSQNSQGGIVQQAGELSQDLPPVVAEFGTNHFNIICHSKGGLDSRQWIVGLKDLLSPNLILGQYITIDTPHKGSVVADFAIISTNLTSAEVAPAQAAVAAIDLNDGPIISVLITAPILGTAFGVFPDTVATIDLQVSSMVAFNNTNMPLLAAYVNPTDGTRPECFGTKADADLNGDSQITNLSPIDELANARCYEFGAGIAGNVAYQALRYVTSASLSAPDPGTGLRSIQLSLHPEQNRQKNDLLVTYDSAIPESIANQPFQLARVFEGAAGKDHGNVSDDDTGSKLRQQDFVRRLK